MFFLCVCLIFLSWLIIYSALSAQPGFCTFGFHHLLIVLWRFLILPFLVLAILGSYLGWVHRLRRAIWLIDATAVECCSRRLLFTALKAMLNQLMFHLRRERCLGYHIVLYIDRAISTILSFFTSC
jgi:hypothetical protein